MANERLKKGIIVAVIIEAFVLIPMVIYLFFYK
jgi:F0F1-type ATP synthase membrane subunit c/vacuolar-type H+-ATPase subunit K